MGRGPEQTFFLRRHTDGKQTQEKMLNITIHQGNAMQTYNDTPTDTCQNGYHQKHNKL